jgi:cytochrome c556
MAFVRLTACALVALALAGTSVAAISGADAAKARKDHMKALGQSSKAIGQQLKGGSPDLAIVRAEAAKIDAAAKLVPTWFPAGSGPGAGVKTEALALVWTDPRGFRSKADALALAATRFDKVAQAGDASALGGAFHDVGQACKACHQTYKEKDKD